jgi:hypothetical protein
MLNIVGTAGGQINPDRLLPLQTLSAGPSALPATPALATGPGHLGCFNDNVWQRGLADFWNTGNSSMTIELCRDMAVARGLRYYGLQWTSDCYATNNDTSPFMHKTGRPCNMPCAGNVTQRCGGDQANDVYDVTLGELVSC